MCKKMVLLVALVFVSLLALSGFAVAVTSSDGQMTVTSPTPGSTISNGVVVNGKARIFEAQFNYQLIGEKSGVIASGNAKTEEGSAFAPFSFTLTFDSTKVVSGDTGTLRVFDESMKDGSEISVVEIPIKFAQAPAQLAYTGGDASRPYMLGAALAFIGVLILSADFFKRTHHHR